MHKYFAKTRFLGKRVEYLPECHSTNSVLAALLKKVPGLPEGTLVLTDYQDRGRGQRGNAWVSEPAKNLLVSLLVKPTFLRPDQVFMLNIITALAVADTISALPNPEASPTKLEVKWPNDVYLNERKVSGILVETSINRDHVDQALVGIGLNVNQTFFRLPEATSLAMERGVPFDRWHVLETLLISLEGYILKLKAKQSPEILEAYYSRLMWLGSTHAFRACGVTFSGVIKGIDGSGKLCVASEGQLKYYEMKEIEFLH